jgi:tRNA 2-thiouridine synthesizing protein E
MTTLANAQLDADGFLTNAEDWTPELSEEFAREAEIELTDRHWEVIDFCRRDFAEKGTAPTVRRITKVGGIPTKEMYQLFPGGPGILAARISGLPKPKGCI